MICKAKTQAGRACRKTAIRGGTVCTHHGGNAPQVRAAARRRLAVEEASAALERMGQPVDIEPVEALKTSLCLAAGQVAFLRAHVEQLPVHPVVADSVRDEFEAQAHGGALIRHRADWVTRQAGTYAPDHLGDAAPHVFVAMYHQALDRLAKIAKLAIDAGLKEREIELAEQQGALVAQIISHVLKADELALTAEQKTAALKLAANALRAAAREEIR